MTDLRTSSAEMTGSPVTQDIVMMPIKDLRFYPGNPRTWTPDDLEHLKTGITRNGWLVPVVVNRAESSFNTILSGHMRICAARELGWVEVPTIHVNIEDREQERDIVLRLNRNVGSWDWPKLAEYEFAVLESAGFDSDDLTRIFEDLCETEDDQFNEQAELEKIKVPQSKVGDLYMLGDHRLIVGDSTDLTVVQRLMGGEKASMIDVDPPYSIGLDYNKGIGGKRSYGGKTNDNMSLEDYTTFLRKLMKNAMAVAEPDAHYFFWCDQNWIWRTQTLYQELGIKHQRVCWWLKGQFMVTPSVAFNKAGEAIIYGITGSPYLAPNITNLHELQDKEIGTGGRMIDDVIDMFSIWLCKRLPGSEMEHPTEKNPSVHEKALRRCSKPGDRILDLCGGSGSLLVASHQMHRRAYLVEHEPILPIYVSVVLKMQQVKKLPSYPMNSHTVTIGDIYQVGSHRVACGDCRDAVLVERVLHEDTVAMILTDIPYAVAYVENKLTKGGTEHEPIANDHLQSDEEFSAFTQSWLEAVRPFLKPKNSGYTFCSDKMLFAFRDGMVGAGFRFGQLLHWLKTSSVLGRLDYSPQHETVLYFWHGTHEFMKSHDKSIIIHPKPAKNKHHPTSKPIPVLQRFILNSSRIGDLVYDPFAGSGTTALAAEITGRRSVSIELLPKYCQIIIGRLEKITGLKAKKISSTPKQCPSK